MSNYYIQYAVIILVVDGFCVSYKVFITPAQLSEIIENLKKEIKRDYVSKEVHDLAINEMKADVSDIKNKIDKIYDKIMYNS